MIIQPSVASSRRKSSNRAKQSVSALVAEPRAVFVAPVFVFDQDSLHSYSSNHSTSSISDDECGSVVGEDYSLIDLSNDNLGFLPDFINEKKDCIEHLILDGNQLTEHSLEELPFLPKLKSLSLNSNKVKNIGLVLQFLSRQCPNLSFLSLIGNPGWPHPIINADIQLYQSYALAAAKFLPHLRFLDTSSVAAIPGNSRTQQCHII